MKIFALSVFLFTALARAVTITTATASYTVNAESSNAFVVVFSRTTCDITSIKYRGTEVQYQGGMKSHISSGWSSATVSATTITSNSVTYAKITCVSGAITQYYVVRDGDSSLHMGTYATAEPAVGELRWIGRLISSVLPDDDVGNASNVGGGTAIEGSDVYLVNGQTRSKFYSSQRFIDDQVHCLSGSDIKACMLIPGTGYETSSGGPFFRDINMNPGGEYNTLYLYMNSGHTQTEAYRTGFFGPYSCVFSRSGTPSPTTDLSFMGSLGLTGFVPVSSRGYVSGTASGVDGSKYPIVLHWYNSAAQYWKYASSSGSFTSPPMKAGTYTMVLYQDELKVAETSVSVTSGATASKNIASSWTLPANTIFQIGEWDGRPTGFRNAANQLRMHPSDSRMASWGPLTYTVGTSTVANFPMAVFKGLNDVTIKFTVAAAQAGVAATLRIGTTLSFASGRPAVTVNGVAQTVPAAPTKIDSRGVTRGAYRGHGTIYNFAISNLVSGTNTIVIGVASGESGTEFLAPNYIFDSVHLFSSAAGTGTTTSSTTLATSTSSRTTTSTTQSSVTLSTTSRAATTTTASGGGTVPGWGQCGGSGWTGGTVCVSGYTCTYSNEWYSQCTAA